MRSEPAALGFAPHSGWAVVVGVSEGHPHVRVPVRERIELADPGDPMSRQPYHAVEGLPVGEASKRVAAYAASAERLAHEAIRRVEESLSGRGHRVVGVGILESAGRKGGELAAILASHALIHTADGDHFRNAISAAAARRGLPVLRVPARELESRAAAETGTPPARLQAALKVLGRELGPPWTADQKAAALLAWLVLAKAAGRRAASAAEA